MMTPEQLDAIEARAEAAKSVTGDDTLEAHVAWVEDWSSIGYVVTNDALSVPYALCVAEETAELIFHAPDDIAALVAEVRRLSGVVAEVRAKCAATDRGVGYRVSGQPDTWGPYHEGRHDFGGEIEEVLRPTIERKDSA